MHRQFSTCTHCDQRAVRVVDADGTPQLWAHVQLPADHHAPVVDQITEPVTCGRCGSDATNACPDALCPKPPTFAADQRTGGDIRANVLAIHKPTQVWTDSIVTDDETQEALYDDADALVYAGDIRTVCEGCGIPREVPWPCPTARAVGVTA